MSPWPSAPMKTAPVSSCPQELLPLEKKKELIVPSDNCLRICDLRWDLSPGQYFSFVEALDLPEELLYFLLKFTK